MARLRHRSIAKRTVDALPVGDRDAVFWDDRLPGFGVRVYPSGAKVYIVQTRHHGRSRRASLGRHGVITADQARRAAAAAIHRIKTGRGPAARPAGAVTVAALAARYLQEHVEVRCQASTQRMYRSIIGRFILPAYGHLAVAAVERRHIDRLHFDLRHIPCQANRVLAIGSQLFGLAEAWQLRRTANPCRSVRKYREAKRERFLTDAEFRRLGAVLDAMEADGSLPVPAAAAIRLLLLTGCRRNEIVALAWRHVDLAAGEIRLLLLTGCRRNEIVALAWRHVDLAAGEIRLRGSKTGPRMVPLPAAAAQVLRGLPRRAGNPWVIPGTKAGRHLADLNHYWARVRRRADLADVRLHDLRHSFASRALALGESLPMIGQLLGHRRIGTTARYAHLARDSIKAASARVAGSIGADILDRRRNRAAPA